MRQVIQFFLIIVAVAGLLSVCGRKGPEGPPDLAPPVVVGTSPADQTLEVPADTALSVTFSEPVSESTVTLVLVDITNHIPSVPMSMSCSGATAVFTPTSALKLDSLYGATVRSGVRDSAGNSMVADHTWYFRTSATMVNSPTFTVTATAGANGTISPNGTTPVKQNSTQSFTLAPSTGFHIASVTGCGGTRAGTTYTTGAITADCTVAALFEADDAVSTHTVTAKAGSNGSIDPESETVAHGGTAQFTVIAKPGHHIQSVTGCGGSLNGNTYTTGAITADCIVTASFAADVPATHTIFANAGANGSIEPETTTVADGAAAQFTVAPSTGYHIDSVSGCGGSLAGNTYTTGAVRADCTITANFKENAVISYKIEASADSHGEIIPSGTVAVPAGQDTSFEIKADIGYIISEVTVDGKNIDAPRLISSLTYKFPEVRSDHTIKARFKGIWKINAGAGPNGSITPSGTVFVEEGTDKGFVIAPVSAEYVIQDVLVDNSSVGAVPNFMFISVSTDHTITASFAQTAPVSFLVTPEPIENGSMDPAEPQPVETGTTTSFTISANAGYHIVSITGCSGNPPMNDQQKTYEYTTGPITADCSITATLAPDDPVTHVVSASVDGEHGEIDPSGEVRVEHGRTVEFEIETEDDYEIVVKDRETACGGLLSGNTYITAPVIADCTVEVLFTRIEKWLGSSRSEARGSMTDNRAGKTVTAAAI